MSCLKQYRSWKDGYDFNTMTMHCHCTLCIQFLICSVPFVVLSKPEILLFAQFSLLAPNASSLLLQTPITTVEILICFNIQVCLVTSADDKLGCLLGFWTQSQVRIVMNTCHYSLKSCWQERSLIHCCANILSCQVSCSHAAAPIFKEVNAMNVFLSLHTK